MSSSLRSSIAESAINRIKAEHRTFARMLGVMQALIASYREPASNPDYDLFEMMLSYIENVPNRLHHPKEDDVLFAAVSRRAPERQALIAELDFEHVKGEPMLAELRRAFEAFRASHVNAINRLSAAVDEFVEFYWTHMRKEEQQLLPAAVEALSSDDWKKVDDAFAGHVDPLSGPDAAAQYRRLYDRITQAVPQPLKSFLADAAPAA